MGGDGRVWMGCVGVGWDVQDGMGCVGWDGMGCVGMGCKLYYDLSVLHHAYRGWDVIGWDGMKWDERNRME